MPPDATEITKLTGYLVKTRINCVWSWYDNKKKTHGYIIIGV